MAVLGRRHPTDTKRERKRVSVIEATTWARTHTHTHTHTRPHTHIRTHACTRTDVHARSDIHTHAHTHTHTHMTLDHTSSVPRRPISSPSSPSLPPSRGGGSLIHVKMDVLLYLEDFCDLLEKLARCDILHSTHTHIHTHTHTHKHSHTHTHTHAHMAEPLTEPR
eukprot:GHVU01016605.1.p4 GENE.GHVU01016605.1~~GHVU01016605.1.p4  ORF type:complete len:165 (+),score=14.22 GHVU01016605.1:1008-1502(+)